jgi:hypothetical protein
MSARHERQGQSPPPRWLKPVPDRRKRRPETATIISPNAMIGTRLAAAE